LEKIFKKLSLKQKNIAWFDQIRSGRRPNTYEIELFIEKHEEQLNSKLNFEFFHLGSYEEVEEAMDKENDYFCSKEFLKQVKRTVIYINHMQPISFLYKKLIKTYSVEKAKKLKGFTKEVIVPLYIQDENIAIINEGFNHDEDIINLLKMSDITLYIVRYHYEYGHILIKVESNKEIDKVLNTLEEEINFLTKRASDMISKIKPRLEKDSYLSLENKKECVDFYYSLSEKKTGTY